MRAKFLHACAAWLAYSRIAPHHKLNNLKQSKMNLIFHRRPTTNLKDAGYLMEVGSRLKAQRARRAVVGRTPGNSTVQ